MSEGYEGGCNATIFLITILKTTYLICSLFFTVYVKIVISRWNSNIQNWFGKKFTSFAVNRQSLRICDVIHGMCVPFGYVWKEKTYSCTKSKHTSGVYFSSSQGGHSHPLGRQKNSLGQTRVKAREICALVHSACSNFSSDICATRKVNLI